MGELDGDDVDPDKIDNLPGRRKSNVRMMDVHLQYPPTAVVQGGPTVNKGIEGHVIGGGGYFERIVV